MTTRRMLLGGAFGWAGALAAAKAIGTAQAASFDLDLPEAEWRKRLSADQFAVLRKDGTERPYTSGLLDEHRHGVFTCAGCDRDLFASETKFDSGTGWPSFWAPLDKAVSEENDGSFGMSRTAVRCSRCGGHLGHVFNDGPKPTGLRYCMNGVALGFKATAA